MGVSCMISEVALALLCVQSIDIRIRLNALPEQICLSTGSPYFYLTRRLDRGPRDFEFAIDSEVGGFTCVSLLDYLSRIVPAYDTIKYITGFPCSSMGEGECSWRGCRWRFSYKVRWVGGFLF